MSQQRQRGFSVVEVVIAVVVVAAIATTGYLAYGRMKDASKAPTASDQVQKGTTPSAPAVSSAKDLDTSSKTLDDTNVDATTADTADLDAELNNL
ncbi:MAG TPA: prepilin-type N-terminal cleavage/methylation domain-containing protein [Candidatus Pristimantibacillus sp.]|jgi:prepilin-type N-terminal cleavage/methylation domain-containing protein|nr:prepilin-type N-terminal cleavage/methylation domain-containing protein [Candidatus Pristimantibacillus sp.]